MSGPDDRVVRHLVVRPGTRPSEGRRMTTSQAAVEMRAISIEFPGVKVVSLVKMRFSGVLPAMICLTTSASC